MSGQGIRFKFVQAVVNCRTLTFTLPYAGATRIRFEGLPAICQALSLPTTDTPSIESTLNRAILASQIAPSFCASKNLSRG